MANLSISPIGKAVKGRSVKALPNVDLTAMVDLAFLLITFFMLTTSLTKMKGMDIAKPVPVDDETDLASYPSSRTMTILLGKDNQAVYYMGEVHKSIMNVIPLDGIRAKIVENRLNVQNAHLTNTGKKLLVIIKPTSKSVYKNFIDIIDEMHIAGIESYAIDDKYIRNEELVFMKMKGI
ncbi:MAG TPA: biopolymer transporter ExbD [Pedobacter sp.]|nr:biopolymer transporter ExbD [Pedobacter sp.]